MTMDWLLKLLGVSARNRNLLKKTTKLVNSVGKSNEQNAKSAIPTSKLRKKLVDIDELPYDEYEIVGESHYQANLEKIAGPKTESGIEFACEVLLVCENSNKFDKNAVRVEVGGKTVGYLARDDAEIFREMLEEEGLKGAKVTARAKITGGWRRDDGEGHYGISLDLD